MTRLSRGPLTVCNRTTQLSRLTDIADKTHQRRYRVLYCRMQLDRASVSDVAAWLEEQGLPDLSKRANECGIDGATLLELDSAGWQELGVSSAVQRARLLALVRKQQQLPLDSAATTTPPSVDALPNTSWNFVAKHGSRFSADGAAEHIPEWHSAVASASTNGAVAKNHVLGFLGMYNVLSLLVFTIAFTCLFTLQPIVNASETLAVAAEDSEGPATTRSVRARIAEWFDAINFILFALSAIMSFGGLNTTSIAYNTASACSDANATALIKMPSFAKYLKAANDASIFGSMPLFLATIILTLKHGLVLVPYDGTPVAIFLVAATILVFAGFAVYGQV